MRTYHWRTVRRATAALATIAALSGVGTAWATEAKADPPGTVCATDSGFWIFKGTRRTLCDTAPAADGSWTRYREFWTPAHNVPLTCSTFGGAYYATTSCTGGYWQPMTSNGIEQYPVNPAIVLPDEPGNLWPVMHA